MSPSQTPEQRRSFVMLQM
ncbi:hypothetical protein K1T35_17785 [Pseudonocardia sp. DSM 110487]|nr:hypothetical protein K1T35_17785 [Pseudonocardia sp. DSM 110487]